MEASFWIKGPWGVHIVRKKSWIYHLWCCSSSTHKSISNPFRDIFDLNAKQEKPWALFVSIFVSTHSKSFLGQVAPDIRESGCNESPCADPTAAAELEGKFKMGNNRIQTILTQFWS